MLLSSCSGRNPIGRRTESDRTADGTRSDGGRNPIGRRTESDRTADGNGRGCSCLSCTNQANRQSIAAVSAAPTKQTGNLLQLSSLGFAACQSKNCTNQANRTIYYPPTASTLIYSRLLGLVKIKRGFIGLNECRYP